ncbi:MAG: glycosyltransferase [Actinobacteria bacterium]|nr:glycosyltransferase [Actinomycetota bacterium]MBM3713836.1 glycosyltransferase [Actinomycetota bacterium]
MQKESNSIKFVDVKSLLEFVPYKWEKDITIFVSCYNEEGNIINTINTITSVLFETKFSWEIIVIDDASVDKSRELIYAYIKGHPDCDIKLMVRERNVGLAQNYIEGAFMARGRYYKLVCGDNAEQKQSLAKILSFLGKADMIIPYFVKVEGKSFMRCMFSKIYTFMTNIISGYRIKYYNGCALHLTFNIMRWHTDHLGFSFQADVITRLLDQGMSYMEISATAQERKTGASTALKLINFLSVSHFFFELLLRRFGRMYRNKKFK